VHTVIVGAGPTGLYTAIAMARRGRSVVVVDRDPGPPPHGSWQRRGVMQFHHAHTFRGRVVDALRAEMPDVLDHLTAAGAEIAMGRGGRPAALLCRRSTFDRALRRSASAQRGITVITGHVDELLQERGRVAGLTVDGSRLAADIVIDASGRASRFTRAVRPPAEGGDCGAVYVTRQYQRHPNVPPAPVNSPIGLSLDLAGYLAIAFGHDNGTFSITFIYDGSEKRLRRLRYRDVFEAAVGSIPRLSEWTDPARSHPITPVLPGGRLYNSYRRQLDRSGHPALPGLISVGDAVCTTTPLAGRGVTLALLQARELVAILEQHPHDITSATAQFDRWCVDHIRPWFDDHRYTDADRVRRWSGGDVDLSRPLPSDLIVAAADADPQLRRIVEPYRTMDALPASLIPAEPRARAIFATGWRPLIPDGPTRDELAELCNATCATPEASRPPVAV
jgi:2-polyprenyl-6-methoxyphenol hydroxylase-like FAD-dependent oxidoreductase